MIELKSKAQLVHSVINCDFYFLCQNLDYVRFEKKSLFVRAHMPREKLKSVCVFHFLVSKKQILEKSMYAKRCDKKQNFKSP